MSWRVLPVKARSASTSPMTLQNLYPWPEQAEQTTTCSQHIKFTQVSHDACDTGVHLQQPNLLPCLDAMQ